MGDMADYDIEAGMLALTLHETGECGLFGICPYCEEEYKREKALQKPKTQETHHEDVRSVPE